ncbi:uncharacterized protein CIMG_13057 [Coccidioides immitis RS]|uniref:Uncharacterized protein n=1 Tax=Coccidioides immitis (strain RS) TaxID=246410 RepID=J3K855_COCIM|nr:uncharacterized protein CIMG_13057 [Coccidioides immitis RS]EAS30969.3 hypothetical protein CIMG_13057 [Coccidioides immitis RS]
MKCQFLLALSGKGCVKAMLPPVRLCARQPAQPSPAPRGLNSPALPEVHPNWPSFKVSLNMTSTAAGLLGRNP